MNEMNSTTGDRHVDLVIDDVVARRTAGSAAGEPAPARLSSDEALIVELSKLADIDWPADEVGDRIAMSVAAAAGQHAELVPGSVQDRRQRARARHRRAGRSRWLGAGAAAAAAALVAVAIATIGAPHGGARSTAGHKTGRQQTGRAKPPTAKVRGASLTAMTVVAPAGALRAIGAVSDGDNFLTCVTPSVCYIEGSTDGGNLADVARSLNGGATWNAGEPLPALSNSSSFDWNAPLSCPRPQTCYSAFGPGLLETTDGFAHYRFQPVTLPAGMPGQLSEADEVSCPTTRHCVADVTLSNNSQTFIYSDDGGVTWAAASAPAFGVHNNVVGQLRCDRGGACIAAVTGGDEETPTVSALASADGGRSWTMSATYVDPGLQTWTASCGDARDCMISGSTGTTNLAWLHVTADGSIVIRVRPIPRSWATTLDAGSCATGSDCFVETHGSLAGSYYGRMIEATRDGGLTWTGTPVYPADQSEAAIYLSCPVPAGCIAVAGDSTEQSDTWMVLSNLHNGG